MAGAPRTSPSAKKETDDHAALTLLDAAFSISLVERERLVREALQTDDRLCAWATQWAASGGGESDVGRAVASALFSFLDSLNSDKPAKRRKPRGVPLPLSDEWRKRLSSVAARLSDVEALLRRFDDELAAAKIDALKEFAYGAGHEINNPLANISARAQTLLRDETHGERRRMLATINRQAMRAHEMIADLMLFARPPRLECTEVDATALVARVVEEMTPFANAQATRLTFREPGSLFAANVDAVQLGVAVKAIVRNALEAVAAGGNVDVEVRVVSPNEFHGDSHREDSHREARNGFPQASTANEFRRTIPPPAETEGQPSPLVEISVRDDGPGFSAREQAHLFDPFFSGREAGRGLGFGLCLAWRIASDHGGQIAVMSEPGRGATVVLALPVDRPDTNS